ncbi:YqgQ family protein [Alteribacillus sp. HJP-4]|uniref:YqgQ family protein n=1 Tax=Alteribacillus sp. HJP-4 TaxID=2775394 RepID=UPI0035CCFFE6
METMTDVRLWLKQMGTFIYTKNRQTDLELMEEELKEAYKLGIMDSDTFRKATLIIRKEMKAGR